MSSLHDIPQPSEQDNSEVKSSTTPYSDTIARARALRARFHCNNNKNATTDKNQSKLK